MALNRPSHPMQPYPSAVSQIEAMEDLETGWNGHRASRISKGSQQSAIQFLWRVWEEFRNAVPEPTIVAPTSDGGVALEWIVKYGTEERGIEIVCLPANRYEYSVRNRVTGQLEEDQEGILDLGMIMRNVIKPHVAHQFVRAK